MAYFIISNTMTLNDSELIGTTEGENQPMKTANY